jgi:hypothetical protein
MEITSKAQQKFFGAVASGSASKTGLSPQKARLMLHENRGKMRSLPDRASGEREKRPVSRRSNYRSGRR